MSTALWLSWRVAVTCWRSGDGFWMLRLGRGLLEKEIAAGGFSDRKWVYVFVVEGFVCEELSG